MSNKFQPYPNSDWNQHWSSQDLPIDCTLAIYARQSGKNQVIKFVQSGEMQTSDLIALAKQLGWTDDLIILYIENLTKDGIIKDASGRLHIDQREGLQALVENIEKGIIKAVLVFLEDRLFRDETQIQVNVFIEICRRHNCIVMTPKRIYNFHDSYDVEEFRRRCEEAANYFRDHIQSRLNGAIRKVSEKGLYDGRSIPIGFVIDRRKAIIENGIPIPNLNYRKYREWEPHAQVVQHIFDMYFQNGGILKPLYRELCQEPVLFPPFPEDMPQEVIGNRNLKIVPGGYHISESGVKDMLTNVAYIGWWRYRGEVYKDNHVPIIEEEKFWFAFNRLSSYLPDGSENTSRAHKRTYEKRNTPGILKDYIKSASNEQVVYAAQKFGRWFYELAYRQPHANIGHIVTIQMNQLDEIFADKLIEHLQEDINSYNYYSLWLEKRTQVNKSASVSIDQQITAIATESIEIQEHILNPKLSQRVRSALEEDLVTLLEQKKQLEAKRASLISEQDGTSIVSLFEYKVLLEKGKVHWLNMNLKKQRGLVSALGRTVKFASLSPHFLYITVEWSNPTWKIDECLIWRNKELLLCGIRRNMKLYVSFGLMVNVTSLCAFYLIEAGQAYKLRHRIST